MLVAVVATVLVAVVIANFIVVAAFGAAVVAMVAVAPLRLICSSKTDKLESATATTVTTLAKSAATVTSTTTTTTTTIRIETSTETTARMLAETTTAEIVLHQKQQNVISDSNYTNEQRQFLNFALCYHTCHQQRNSTPTQRNQSNKNSNSRFSIRFFHDRQAYLQLCHNRVHLC